MTSDVERLHRRRILLAEHEQTLAAGKHPHKDTARELHDLLAETDGHIFEGRIPMTTAEHAAVDALLEAHGPVAMLTRRDPGNTGPVLVHIGEAIWAVAEDGKTTKAAG